jgi:hypothetical protein
MSITKKQYKVNNAYSHHRHTSRREPTTAEFIKLNPLPAHLSHLKAEMLKLPFHMLIELIVGGSEVQATDAQICAGIKAAAAFYTHTSHRCGSCFGWTDNEHTFVAILDGEYHFSACCEKCKKKIRNGTATQAMKKNMRGHLMGGAR